MLGANNAKGLPIGGPFSFFAYFGSINNLCMRTFTICGLVATIDGRTLIKETLSGPIDSPEIVGVKLAERLVSMGAETIMENLKADLNLNHER